MDIVDQVLNAQKAEAEAEKQFCQLSKSIFHELPAGKKWLRLAMARYNFTGSVFSTEDGMNSVSAAHRDGMRAVISDILNSAVTADQTPTDHE